MESITACMQNDHVEIDAIAARAAAYAAAGDLEGLAREAAHFLRRLDRHIELEERLLFPAFEERTGMVTAGPSVQMREEHAQMRDVLRQMEEALAGRDGAGWQRTSQALFELLVPHNAKEEQMMYPMLDDALGADAAALLDEVKATAA